MTIDSSIGASGHRFTRPLFAAGVATAIVALAATLALVPEVGRDAAVLAARYTARTSASWFLLVFFAAPLARLWRGAATRTVLRERRGLGLAFGGAHLVHLAAIAWVISYDATFGIDIIGGVLVYLSVLAMMLTSSDRAVAWLGARRWKMLHTTGLWFVWVVFLITYAGNLGTPEALVAHWLFTGLFVAGLLARIAARFAKVGCASGSANALRPRISGVAARPTRSAAVRRNRRAPLA